VKPQQDNSQNQFLVHHEGQVQGPFDLDFIEAMVMSGVYAPTVIIQKAGAASQISFSQLIQSRSGASTLSQGAAPGNQRESSSAPRAPAARSSGSSHESTPQTGIADSKPVSTEAKFAWGVCIAGGLLIFWMLGEVSSKKTTSAPSSYNSWNRDQPQQLVPPKVIPALSQPAYTPPAPKPYTPPPLPRTTGFSTNSYQRSPPATTPKSASEESTQVYRDASGRMFRVPNSAYYSLLAKKTALQNQKVGLDRAESEVSALATDIDSSRRYLDRTSQYSVDSFNQKVNHFNAMSERLQTATDSYNRGVDAFNAELARVGTPIY